MYESRFAIIEALALIAILVSTAIDRHVFAACAAKLNNMSVEYVIIMICNPLFKPYNL